MPGFVTRKWSLNGVVMDESTYPSDYAYITKMKVQTELQFFGALELELTFDPPVIHLSPAQARQLRLLLDEHDPDDPDTTAWDGFEDEIEGYTPD